MHFKRCITSSTTEDGAEEHEVHEEALFKSHLVWL